MMWLDLERLVEQIPDRQSLEHQDRALLVCDVVRQLDELFLGNVALRRIAPEGEVVSDAITGIKLVTPGPTDITSPAASLPAMNGNPGALYRPVR